MLALVKESPTFVWAVTVLLVFLVAVQMNRTLARIPSSHAGGNEDGEEFSKKDAPPPSELIRREGILLDTAVRPGRDAWGNTRG